MQLDAEDVSLDAVYSNAVDHAFDVDSFFKEQARVVKPGGIGVFDLLYVEDEGEVGEFEAVSWDTTETPLKIIKRYFPTIVSDTTDGRWRTVIVRK